MHVSDTHIQQQHKEIYWMKQLVSFLKHNTMRWSQLLTLRKVPPIPNGWEEGISELMPHTSRVHNAKWTLNTAMVRDSQTQIDQRGQRRSFPSRKDKTNTGMMGPQWENDEKRSLMMVATNTMISVWEATTHHNSLSVILKHSWKAESDLCYGTHSQEALRGSDEGKATEAGRLWDLLQLSGKNLMILSHVDSVHWCFPYLNIQPSR